MRCQPGCLWVGRIGGRIAAVTSDRRKIQNEGRSESHEELFAVHDHLGRGDERTMVLTSYAYPRVFRMFSKKHVALQLQLSL